MFAGTYTAEILFREKAFRLLQEHDLLSNERITISGRADKLLHNLPTTWR